MNGIDAYAQSDFTLIKVFKCIAIKMTTCCYNLKSFENLLDWYEAEVLTQLQLIVHIRLHVDMYSE